MTRLGLVEGSINSPLITLEAKQIKPVLARRPGVCLTGYIYEHIVETFKSMTHDLHIMLIKLLNISSSVLVP